MGKLYFQISMLNPIRHLPSLSGFFCGDIFPFCEKKNLKNFSIPNSLFLGKSPLKKLLKIWPQLATI
jgi:hypothetical protein